ncbi:MAG: sugar ABC transporter ATP-binding protein [Oscillospiraceae bacterium]|nr:sugar ABC transporter ATP-binding protein [Oscillospiraceae bacterium]MDD3260361.1 sugar ABC transporter ATP-binding protein [Oscillospiraceae bacterium]
MENAKGKVVLTMKGMKKYFPGTKALDWADDDVVEIHAGEIHGLVGENGAGKSTLFQILMGIYDSTGGSMELFGKPYDPKNVDDAENAGISIIMQQPNFAFNLTVAENIFMGCDKQFKNKAGLIDWKRQNAAAAEILHRFQYDDIKPTEVLSDLGFEKTKQVEIARALSQNPKVLLVDETSAAISKSSVDNLYKLLREQRDKGMAIIYISHFIDEVHDLCDRVSVLRDGKLISNMNVSDVTADMIIRSMVGRDVSDAVYRSDDSSSIADVMLETKSLTREGDFSDINIQVHAGEIVGIAGLGGCGSDAFGKALFGYELPTGGEVIYKGRPVKVKSPLEAMKLGFGYIPKDRDKEGLFLIYDLVMNISAANLKNVSKNGIIDHKKERGIAKESIQKFLIKTPSESTPVSDLSGGNRQKVAISKWVVNQSEFLIVNSPTRGVDVGAKYEIYKILEDLKNEGKGILLISDELPELLGMSDRVYCFKKGMVSGEFKRNAFTEELVATKMV